VQPIKRGGFIAMSFVAGTTSKREKRVMMQFDSI